MNTFFSCLVDTKIKFQIQAMLWATSLMQMGDVCPKNIYIQYIGKLPGELLEWAGKKGINLVPLTPFKPNHPYCNKLQQLDTFIDSNANYVCFMDADTVVSRPLEKLVLTDGNLVSPTKDFYAKVVDAPNPPTEILRNIFREAGLGEINSIKATFPVDGIGETDRNNFNGGFYFICRSFLNELSPVWKKWAKWCVENISIFESYSNHADQVSLALSLRELDCSVDLLDITMNLPFHVPELLTDVQPAVLHYHDRLDPMLKLKLCGKSLIDDQVIRINAMIDEFIKEELSMDFFWTVRYDLFPEMGSGLGSRGEFIKLKRQIVASLTFGMEKQAILDVGCGDLKIMQTFNFTDYTGIDIAFPALVIAQKKRPDWAFICANPIELGNAQFDVVICMDVLIHQKNEENYHNLLAKLIRLTRCRLIISGYEKKPEYSSSIVHFFGSLSKHLRAIDEFSEIMVTHQYRDVYVVCADKEINSGIRHPRDISPSDLHLACNYVDRRDLLRTLVDVARHYIGFFPAQFTRMIEYPWILKQIYALKEKGRVLDVGAGVNPLPFCLRLRGYQVETVDDHAMVRDLNNRETWNEWGYLDYGKLLGGIVSHHKSITALDGLEPFDVIYSVSVVEHLPAKLRRRTFQTFNRLMRSGSCLLLTLDIFPNSEALWNKSEGLDVEEIEIHGNAQSVLDELCAYGFVVKEYFFKRENPNARTDLMFIRAEFR
jgi:2-polyprenyl-3-methyl-5-hydroxy-6-metoxy-1,4-benzoquinol methylase